MRYFDERMKGEHVGRYEILLPIASGGMGTVSLARLQGVGGFQRLVAVKQLHDHLRTDVDFVRMFLDEARLAARIHHPNVVSVTEVGGGANGVHLVMDFVEGCNAWLLSEAAIDAGSVLPRPIVLRIVLDALAGLAAAHGLVDDDGTSFDIVHRDVSPQNILVGIDGLSRLTDFGIARAASRLYQSSAREVKGKMGYMAPEQIEGLALDARVDLFAMGVVLWELVAARPLFHGPNDAATIHRVLNVPTPRLGEVVRDVPASLEDVCVRALERERADRFASAEEMLDALEAAARECGGAATHREVAACVDRLVGDQVRARRSALTAAASERKARPSSPDPIAPPVGHTQPGSPGLPSSRTERAVASPQARAPEAPSPRRLALWAIVSLIALSAIASGIVLYRSVPPPRPVEVAASPSPPPSVAEAPPAAVTDDPPPPSAPPVLAASAPPVLAASAPPAASAPGRASRPRVRPSGRGSSEAPPESPAGLNSAFGGRL